MWGSTASLHVRPIKKKPLDLPQPDSDNPTRSVALAVVQHPSYHTAEHAGRMERKEVLSHLHSLFGRYANWTKNKRALYFAAHYFGEGRDEQAIVALGAVNMSSL
jgi:hypothetical protein